jgi:hypothetical protein
VGNNIKKAHLALSIGFRWDLGKLAQTEQTASMPRPQKYSDSEIMAAAKAFIVEGGEINPMRVRMRRSVGAFR